MLFVSQILKSGECIIKFLFCRKLDTELSQTATKCVATGVLTQHHSARSPTNILGSHNLIGLTRLNHAILMYTGLVREGIGTNNGLIGLHGKTGDVRDQAAGRNNVLGFDARIAREHILPSAYCHHDLLERCVRQDR